jgi:hypothetical protein
MSHIGERSSHWIPPCATRFCDLKSGNFLSCVSLWALTMVCDWCYIGYFIKPIIVWISLLTRWYSSKLYAVILSTSSEEIVLYLEKLETCTWTSTYICIFNISYVKVRFNINIQVWVPDGYFPEKTIFQWSSVIMNQYGYELTLWRWSLSKCYLRIQSVPQREHQTSPLQRSTG